MSAKGTFQLATGCCLSAATAVVTLFWLLNSDSQISFAIMSVLLVAICAIMLFGWWTAFLQLTSKHPWHWIRTKLGWGLEVEELANRLGYSVEELIEHQPQYTSAFIPKRSGGTRELRIPDKKTAEIQKRILLRLLAKLRSHPAACGFETGKSIVHNALPHAGKAVVIKLDVVDFFSSTTASRVEAYFCRIGWNQKSAKLLTKLTCEQDSLPQGAATSPRLSNLVNHLLDEQLVRCATKYRGEYSRYADDITYSFRKDSPKRMRGIIQRTRHLLKRSGYQLNSKKQHILRQHQRQTVTGLNVNTKVSLSRKLRRELRAARHRLENGKESTWTAEQLQGWAALEKMIQEQTKS